jgi:hypothetical protein
LQNNNLSVGRIENSSNRTIFVHGTFSDSSTFSDEFKKSVAETLNDPNQEVFNWSGGNSDKARQEGAKELLEQINNGYKYMEGEEVNIVGHSHGGNINKIVSNLYDYNNNPVLNVYNFATPNRSDYVVNTNVNKYYNIYDKGDKIIQDIFGGTDTVSVYLFPISIKAPILINLPKNPTQTDDNAINIGINQRDKNMFKKHIDIKNPETIEELKKYL